MGNRLGLGNSEEFTFFIANFAAFGRSKRPQIGPRSTFGSHRSSLPSYFFLGNLAVRPGGGLMRLFLLLMLPTTGSNPLIEFLKSRPDPNGTVVVVNTERQTPNQRYRVAGSIFCRERETLTNRETSPCFTGRNFTIELRH